MMIRINLLPREFRKNERGSPKVFAATLGAVVAVSAMLGWFGLVYFGDLGELQSKHAVVKEELSGKQKRAAYHDQLEKATKDFSQRVATIQNIAKSRMLWTKVVDEIIDVVDNSQDIDRHLAWFDSLAIKQASGNAKSGPTVKLPGAVQGHLISRAANLHEDLALAPFYVDVASKSLPTGKQALDETKSPSRSYGFNLQLEFKSPDKWEKNQKGPKR